MLKYTSIFLLFIVMNIIPFNVKGEDIEKIYFCYNEDSKKYDVCDFKKWVKQDTGFYLCYSYDSFFFLCFEDEDWI